MFLCSASSWYLTFGFPSAVHCRHTMPWISYWSTTEAEKYEFSKQTSNTKEYLWRVGPKKKNLSDWAAVWQNDTAAEQSGYDLNRPLHVRWVSKHLSLANKGTTSWPVIFPSVTGGVINSQQKGRVKRWLWLLHTEHLEVPPAWRSRPITGSMGSVCCRGTDLGSCPTRNVPLAWTYGRCAGACLGCVRATFHALLQFHMSRHDCLQRGCKMCFLWMQQQYSNWGPVSRISPGKI